MKTIILIISILAIAQGKVYSQEYFHHYDYDNAGNRVHREYTNVYTFENKSALVDSVIKETPSALVGNHSVKLYPNPTAGKMMVQISGMENVSKSQIVVYNFSGQVVFQKTTLGEITEIDLTSQAVGNYFLQITVDGEMSDWKVIKQ